MFSDVCLICLDDVPGKITYLLDCRLLFSFFFHFLFRFSCTWEKRKCAFPFLQIFICDQIKNWKFNENPCLDCVHLPDEDWTQVSDASTTASKRKPTGLLAWLVWLILINRASRRSIDGLSSSSLSNSRKISNAIKSAFHLFKDAYLIQHIHLSLFSEVDPSSWRDCVLFKQRVDLMG